MRHKSIDKSVNKCTENAHVSTIQVHYFNLNPSSPLLSPSDHTHFIPVEYLWTIKRKIISIHISIHTRLHLEHQIIIIIIKISSPYHTMPLLWQSFSFSRLNPNSTRTLQFSKLNWLFTQCWLSFSKSNSQLIF